MEEEVDDEEDYEYDCDCADKAPRDEYWICQKCDAEWPTEEEDGE